MKSVVFCNEL